MYCKHQKRWALTCTVLAPRSMNSAAWLPVSTPPIPERDLSWPGNSALIIWAIDMTFASAIGLTALDEYPPGVEYLLETRRRPAFVQSINWCNVQTFRWNGINGKKPQSILWDKTNSQKKSIIQCNEDIIFCFQRFLFLWCHIRSKHTTILKSQNSILLLIINLTLRCNLTTTTWKISSVIKAFCLNCTK